ncbi:MAG TPA: NAD-binding protein [Armatimonadota bacterium]|nr:NAD-binding protein [Armatimonadota bacterium]
MDPFRQLRFAAFVVVVLLGLGTVGYIYIEGWSILDALYMTVITLTTIGYEVVKPLSTAGKVFTIVLALAGVSILFTVVFWVVGNAIEVASQEKHLFWRRRMEKAIRGVKDHYIICGHGRMGQAIAAEFRARKVPFVVVENNPEQLPRLVAEKVLFVEGDATDEKSLLAAGVERAKGLITVAPTDADNTFIVLTAKGINPNLFVVARSITIEDEPKLRRAGADRVMSPYVLGGKRMAWSVLRPNVVAFLEGAMQSESLQLEITEVTVTGDSEFANKTIRESRIREKSGATVIALKSRSGAMTSSPSPDVEIEEGDVLVAVGTPHQLEVLQRMTE